MPVVVQPSASALECLFWQNEKVDANGRESSDLFPSRSIGAAS